ncbi:MAG: hypothetical protein JW969_04695 [Spirochaetales bacterium]|nr:hypothetical protein [Spirochaetales bacterium]
MPADSYLDRGVSPTKDDVKKAIENVAKGLYPGAFCVILPDFLQDEKYCSVMHADGAGTKSLTAYLYYREKGTSRYFKGIAQDALVMNLDDLLCVGCTDNFILSNTIGRNAHRVGGEVIREIIEGYVEFTRELSAYGVNVRFAGGETADVGDIVNTIIVDSTVYSRLSRQRVVDAGNIRPGDVIIGLSSFGRAVYENVENSGMGSNGLTLARHVLLSSYYREKYPETYSPTIDPSKVYCGEYRLDDSLPGTSLSIGEALLSPTRTYAPLVKKVLDSVPGQVHGIIHCTGGGQLKCGNFGRGIHIIKENLFETPPLFALIRESGNIPSREMYQVFNMGHRMEIYCNEKAAEAIMESARELGIGARKIGYVEKNKKADANNVTIKTRKETLEFSFGRDI